MGNVQAATAQPPGPMPSPPPGPMPPPPPTSGYSKPQNAPDPISQPPETPIITESRNPGTMEELHKRCKDIFPSLFEGARFFMSKGLSQHFQLSHTIHLSSSNTIPSGYRFGASYVGTGQYSPTEPFPVLLGEIDPNGDLNANVIHQFSPNLRAKFITHFQKSKFNALQVSADYKGPDYTFSVAAANPDIINESGVLVGHYLQSVTKNTDLGAELAYQYGPSVPGGEIAVLSGAARYNGGDFSVSGTLGGSALHVCYFQKASEQLSLGVELDTNFRMQESTASIGYQLDIPQAELSFKGMVDSNWTVGGVLEKKLLPLPFTFGLSGSLNHEKNVFRLGCALMIG